MPTLLLEKAERPLKVDSYLVARFEFLNNFFVSLIRVEHFFLARVKQDLSKQNVRNNLRQWLLVTYEVFFVAVSCGSHSLILNYLNFNCKF